MMRILNDEHIHKLTSACRWNSNKCLSTKLVIYDLLPDLSFLLCLQDSLDGRNSLITLTLLLTNGTMSFHGAYTANTTTGGFARLHCLGGTGEFQSVTRGYFDWLDYKYTILKVTVYYHKSKKYVWMWFTTWVDLAEKLIQLEIILFRIPSEWHWNTHQPCRDLTTNHGLRNL